ncbi:MAG: DNA polymerase III subunit beta [Gammaproteobacteria bacterium]|nr:DNA polymerase III subunit beta [Gammaproteobacteria bacterium]
MKIKREHILQPLQAVVGVVERRHTLPILSQVLIEIADKKITVTATDLEVQLSASAELDEDLVAESFTAPGRKLLDICKTLPENSIIEFIFDTDKIVIKCNKSRFNLLRLVNDDFPLIENDTILVETTLPKKSLQFLLEHTHFSMAHLDVRYFLNGMLMEFSPDKLTAVTADGHRMALAWQAHSIQVEEVIKTIVPRKGILELMRLLSNSPDEITIKVGAHHIHFITNLFSLSSKLIDGKFPDYNRVIPNNGDKVVIIDVNQFSEILQRVSVLLDKNRNISIELANNQLKAVVSNSEHEEAQEEMSIDYSHPPLTLGFNVNYLSDLVNVIENPTFKMTLFDNNSGILFEEEGKPNVLFVIMPMKI